MVSALYVAIYYAPSKVELAHWAMFVQDDDGEEMVLQVIGGDGEDFEFDARETNPTKSKSFSSMLLVSNKLKTDVEKIYEIAQSTEIENNNPEFNCQEWVLASLEDLHDADVFTKEELKRAKTALEVPRGKPGITSSVYIVNGYRVGISFVLKRNCFSIGYRIP